MSVGRTAAIAAAVVILAAGLTAGMIVLLQGNDSRPNDNAASATASLPGTPARDGWPFHRLVPAMALRTVQGRRTSLADMRGKVVVLAPSMTLCHEICPMTTGAFMAMQHRIVHDGLAGKVVFVEASVDPWRDSPARLRAYDRLTGADFIQLTGSVAQMRRFWDFFGVGFNRVPQGHPPDIDWWTHKPEKFDVEHVDGVFLIDAHGYERVFFPGYANVGGHLSKVLRGLLSRVGVKSLDHSVNAWTESQVMAGVGRLLHRRV